MDFVPFPFLFLKIKVRFKMFEEMEKVKSILIDIYLEALELGINIEEIDIWVLKVKQEARDIAQEILKVMKERENGGR